MAASEPAEQYQRPYLESSVLISWIKGEAGRQWTVDHILRLAERDIFKIYTSTLTLAEVHKHRDQPKLLSNEQDERILAYFEHDFFQFIDVDRNIGEHANRLCREHGLFPNDAIHLACALRAGCDVLLSWNGRLNRVQHPHIRTEEPRMLGQAELPEMPLPQ
ncbi:MAG: type II toxin-antitoxin system VapC family toxin [Dehalococcoidia bacterium]|nr:type II toxin-antitoxin system VapC family toxin [Dehalococcoidia bacterium]